MSTKKLAWRTYVMGKYSLRKKGIHEY